MLYFAYGSNLSSPRLRARVGDISIHGPAVLPAHEHQFSKPGRDGTGKGHVAPHPRRRVHGVLYTLSLTQLERLADYEGGYRRTTLRVLPPTGVELVAITFLALRPGGAPPPSLGYLDHYRAGFLEHALPRPYALALLRDAGDDRPL